MPTLRTSPMTDKFTTPPHTPRTHKLPSSCPSTPGGSRSGTPLRSPGETLKLVSADLCNTQRLLLKEQKACTKAAKENKKLKAENSRLASATAQLQPQLAKELEAAKQKLSDERDKHREQLHQFLEKLQQAESRSAAEKGSLEADLAQANSVAEAAKQQVALLQAQVEAWQMRTPLSDRSLEVSSSCTPLQTASMLGSKGSVSQVSGAELDTERFELCRADLDSRKDSITRARDELVEPKTQISPMDERLQREADEHARTVTQLQAQLRTYAQEGEEHARTVTQLQAQLQQSAERYQEATAEAEELREQLSDFEQIVAEAAGSPLRQARLDALENELQDESAARQQEAEAAAAHAAATTIQLDRRQAALEHLSEQLSSTRSAHEQQQQQDRRTIEQLRETTRKLGAELEELQATHKEALQHTQHTDSELHQVTSAYAKAQLESSEQLRNFEQQLEAAVREASQLLQAESRAELEEATNAFIIERTSAQQELEQLAAQRADRESQLEAAAAEAAAQVKLLSEEMMAVKCAIEEADTERETEDTQLLTVDEVERLGEQLRQERAVNAAQLRRERAATAATEKQLRTEQQASQQDAERLAEALSQARATQEELLAAACQLTTQQELLTAAEAQIASLLEQVSRMSTDFETKKVAREKQVIDLSQEVTDVSEKFAEALRAEEGARKATHASFEDCKQKAANTEDRLQRALEQLAAAADREAKNLLLATEEMSSEFEAQLEQHKLTELQHLAARDQQLQKALSELAHEKATTAREASTKQQLAAQIEQLSQQLTDERVASQQELKRLRADEESREQELIKMLQNVSSEKLSNKAQMNLLSQQVQRDLLAVGKQSEDLATEKASMLTELQERTVVVERLSAELQNEAVLRQRHLKQLSAEKSAKEDWEEELQQVCAQLAAEKASSQNERMSLQQEIVNLSQQLLSERSAGKLAIERMRAEMSLEGSSTSVASGSSSVDTISVQLDASHAIISRLQQENTEHRAREVEWESCKKQMEQELRCNKAKLEAEYSVIARLQDQITTLQSQLDTSAKLESEHSHTGTPDATDPAAATLIEQELETVRQELKVTTRELETSMQEAAKVQSAAEEFQELRKQLKKMSQALERSKIEVCQAQIVKGEHHELSRKLEVTNKGLESSRSEITTLQLALCNSIKEAEEEIKESSDAKAIIKVLEASIISLQEQAQRDKASIAALEQQLTESIQTALVKAAADPTSTIQALEMQRQTELAHAAALEAEVKRLKKVSAKQLIGSERVLQMEVEISELSELLVQARVEATAAQQKLTKQDAALRNEEVHGLKAKAEDSADREIKLSKCVEDLQAECHRQKEGCELANNQLKVAKERLRSQERHVMSEVQSKEQLKTMSATVRQVEEQIAESELRYQQQSGQMKQLQTSFDSQQQALASTTSAMQREIDRSAEEVSELRQKLDRAQEPVPVPSTQESTSVTNKVNGTGLLKDANSQQLDQTAADHPQQAERASLRSAVADLIFSNAAAVDDQQENIAPHANKAQSARVPHRNQKKVARPALRPRKQLADRNVLNKDSESPDPRIMVKQLLLEHNPLCSQWTSLDEILQHDTAQMPAAPNLPDHTLSCAPELNRGIVELTVRKQSPSVATATLQSRFEDIGKTEEKTPRTGVSGYKSRFDAQPAAAAAASTRFTVRDPSPLQGRVLYVKPDDATSSTNLEGAGTRVAAKAPEHREVILPQQIPAQHAPPLPPASAHGAQNTASLQEFIRVCGGGGDSGAKKKPLGAVPHNVQRTQSSLQNRGENKAKVEALRQRCDEVQKKLGMTPKSGSMTPQVEQVQKKLPNSGSMTPQVEFRSNPKVESQRARTGQGPTRARQRSEYYNPSPQQNTTSYSSAYKR